MNRPNEATWSVPPERKIRSLKVSTRSNPTAPAGRASIKPKSADARSKTAAKAPPEEVSQTSARLSPYSPDCVEEEFSEVQLRDAERRSVRSVMSSSCSQPSPTKE